MTDSIETKAENLKKSCLRVMHAMEESDGAGSRSGGGMFDHWFEDIPEWFRPFTHLPNHEKMRTQAQTLAQEVCKNLNIDWPVPPGYDGGGPVNTNPDLSYHQAAADNLSGWTGMAASNFKTNFLNKFPYFTKNLYTATYIGFQALQAEARLWETARDDIHKLADDAQHCVDGMIGVSMGKGFNFALTLLPSVINIVSAAETELKMTVIKEAAGKVNPTTFKDAFAPTPASLMQPLKESIDKLKENLKNQEEAIGNALAANTGYLNGHPREYAAPEPQKPGDGSAWGLADTDNRGHEQDGKTTLGDDNHVPK
jgi:hypothetical protein